MLFKYEALTSEGEARSGNIEALNRDVAVRSLQQRGLTIVSIESAEKKPFWKRSIPLFESVPQKDIVVLSRQIATLFTAEVSALRVFRLLGTEVENDLLRRKLEEVAGDIQGGASISDALAKHPNVFSNFYVNMVRAGEESGKLSETFEYLADYLDRSYALTTKARNAFIYPAFVVGTFIVVMVLLLTLVFPRLADILTETGQELPIYTKIIIGLSDFLINYGVFLLVLLILGGFWLWRYQKSDAGKVALSQFKLSLPVFGALYKKLYLSRIADNLNTMLLSGVSLVRALEVSATIVGNRVYEDILEDATQQVRAGSPLSEVFGKYEEIPSIMMQIVRIGEETGELGNILKTLSDFYRREVTTAVDTMVDLIEPIMIVALGLGVGIILASVLLPIYSLSAGF